MLIMINKKMKFHLIKINNKKPSNIKKDLVLHLKCLKDYPEDFYDFLFQFITNID